MEIRDIQGIDDLKAERDSKIAEIDLVVDEFIDLGPIDCVDYSIYDTALKFALSNNNVANVAITGGYGSGKTSFINSFRKRDTHNEWIDISLSQFDRGNDDSIQKAIINQIIYKIDHDSIKRSKLIVHKSSILDDKLMTLSACLLLISLLYFNNLALIRSIFYPIIKSWNDVFYNTIAYSRVHLFFPTLVFLVSLCIFVYKLIVLFEQHKLKISLSFLGGSMEGDSQNSKDSYIDDNLKEIVYVLENTKANVFIFQDLDRLSEKLILSKLRELSQLVNRGEKKSLKFLYLLRDDVFLTGEFTKFFDFTIPILPHLDSNNSYDRLFTEINRVVGRTELITRRFMKSVSPYITNSRMLKNISNDYLIYRYKLNIKDNEIQNLYGIMILKNVLPLEVRELMISKGVLFGIIDSKSKIIDHLPDITAEDTSKRDMYTLSLMNLINLFNKERTNSEKDWISIVIDSYLSDQSEESKKERNFTVIRESINLIRYLFESGMITEFNYLRLLSDSKDSVLSPRDRSFLDSQFQPESLGYNYRLDNPKEVVKEIEFEDIGVNSLNIDYINAVQLSNKMITRMRDIILDYNELDILLEKELDITVVKSLLGYKLTPDLSLLTRLLEKNLKKETVSLFIHFSLFTMLTAKFDYNIKELIEEHCTIDSMKEFLSLTQIHRLCSENHIKLNRVASKSLLDIADHKILLDIVKDIPFIFNVYNFNVIVSLMKKNPVIDFDLVGIELIIDSEYVEIYNNLISQIKILTTDLKGQGLRLDDNFQIQTKIINSIEDVEDVKSYMEVQVNYESINLVEVETDLMKNELVLISAYKKNWENYFHIFDFLQIEIDIVVSMNENSIFLISDTCDIYNFESGKDNIEKFFMFLTKSSQLYNEIYRSIVQELSEDIKLIKDDVFDIDKIQIIIEEEKLVFNEVSMNIIFSNYSELTYFFIRQNLSEFLELDEFDIPEGSIQEILLSDDFTINQKQIIIRKNKSLIILEGNNYSEDVIECVLHNKVAPSDLNYLISYFDSVDELSDNNLNKIISLIRLNFEEFCKVDYNLKHSKIGLEYLLQNISNEVEKTLFILDKYNEDIFLNVVKRISQIRPLIANTERNKLISRRIYNLGLSYKPTSEHKFDSTYIRLRPTIGEPL